MFAGLAARALVALVTALAIAAGGVIFGIHLEGWRRDAQDKQLMEAAAKVATHIEDHYREIEIRFVAADKQLEEDRAKVTTDLTKHATLPDPVECYLAPDRVRNINAAFGLSDDQRDAAGAVLNAKPSGLRLSPSGGGVGDGTGLQVPRVR